MKENILFSAHQVPPNPDFSRGELSNKLEIYIIRKKQGGANNNAQLHSVK
jgi:hypothetical protein